MTVATDDLTAKAREMADTLIEFNNDGVVPNGLRDAVAAEILRAERAESALTAMTAERDALADENRKMNTTIANDALEIFALAARVEAAERKVALADEVANCLGRQCAIALDDKHFERRRAEAAEKALAAMREACAYQLWCVASCEDATWDDLLPARREEFRERATATAQLFSKEVSDAG